MCECVSACLCGWLVSPGLRLGGDTVSFKLRQKCISPYHVVTASVCVCVIQYAACNVTMLGVGVEAVGAPAVLSHVGRGWKGSPEL